jgi:hypothetical protein
MAVIEGVEFQADAQTEALPADWQERTAAEKLAHLWDRCILATEFDALPPYDWRVLRLAKSYLEQSFDHVSDELPADHQRVLHLRGSVARAEWRALPDCPYTGLFRGASSALVRMSLGAPPHWPFPFVPGLAVKLLVDGEPSANLHLLHSVEGQGQNRDLFALPLTNRIPHAKGWIAWVGEQFFRQVKDDPYDLPVDHLALMRQDGQLEDPPSHPHQLVFVPGDHVPRRKDPLAQHDFRRDLAAIEPDTLLYEVHACDQPGDEPRHIANLFIRSRFVASWWGDERLYFQHNR